MSEAIQWAKLEPIERDRLVAEKVMGRKIEACNDAYPGSLEITVHCSVCGFVWSQDELMSAGEYGLDAIPMNEQHNEPVPPYTQSMDAAWGVLKHMCHEPEWTEPMMLFINYLDDGIDAVIDRNVTRLEPIFTLTRLSCLTPEAICLAALKAVGIDVGQ